MTYSEEIIKRLFVIIEMNNLKMANETIVLFATEFQKYPQDKILPALDKWLVSRRNFPRLDDLLEIAGLAVSEQKRQAISAGKIEKLIAEIKTASWRGTSEGWSREAYQIASAAGVTPREVYDNWNADTETTFVIRLRTAARGILAEQECAQLTPHQAEVRRLLDDPLMQ